jgi:hypothetical protein
MSDDYISPFEGEPRLVTRTMHEYAPEPMRWIWPGRIAEGKLTLIAGDPGLGKSFLTIDLAARLSRGASMPDGTIGQRRFNGEPRPCDTIFLSAEDDPGSTILPRLHAAGADLSRIHFAEAVARTPGEHDPTVCLDRDIDAIFNRVRSSSAISMIVIDPLSAYLGDVGENRNAEVRGMLQRLAAYAASYRVAIVAVTHLNKKGGDRAIYRAMGSLAFVAAARAVHLVCRHPDDEDARLFMEAKNNISTPNPTLSYRLTPTTLEGMRPMGALDTDDPSRWTIHTARLDWDDAPCAYTSESFDSAEATEQADALEEACAWLLATLRAAPERAMATNAVKECAERDGLSWGAVRRAKRRTGVTASKGNSANAAWEWRAPS